MKREIERRSARGHGEEQAGINGYLVGHEEEQRPGRTQRTQGEQPQSQSDVGIGGALQGAQADVSDHQSQKDAVRQP